MFDPQIILSLIKQINENIELNRTSLAIAGIQLITLISKNFPLMIYSTEVITSLIHLLKNPLYAIDSAQCISNLLTIQQTINLPKSLYKSYVTIMTNLGSEGENGQKKKKKKKVITKEEEDSGDSADSASDFQYIEHILNGYKILFYQNKPNDHEIIIQMAYKSFKICKSFENIQQIQRNLCILSKLIELYPSIFQQDVYLEFIYQIYHFIYKSLSEKLLSQWLMNELSTVMIYAMNILQNFIFVWLNKTNKSESDSQAEKKADVHPLIISSIKYLLIMVRSEGQLILDINDSIKSKVLSNCYATITLHAAKILLVCCRKSKMILNLLTSTTSILLLAATNNNQVVASDDDDEQDQENQLMMMDNDEAIPNYNESIPSLHEFFYHNQPYFINWLAMIAHHDDEDIRNSFMSYLATQLQLGLNFFIFASILTYAASYNKENKKLALETLKYLILNIRQRGIQAKRLYKCHVKIPEMILWNLLYLLSHHDDFIIELPLNQHNQDNDVVFNYFKQFIDFFLDALLANDAGAATTTAAGTNFHILVYIASSIKKLCDIRHVNNDNLYYVAELTIFLLQKRYKLWNNTSSSTTTMNQFNIPPAYLYQYLPKDKQVINKYYLPLYYRKILETKNQQQANMLKKVFHKATNSPKK